MSFGITVNNDNNHSLTFSKNTLARRNEANVSVTVTVPAAVFALGSFAYVDFLLPDGTAYYKGPYDPSSGSFTFTLGSADIILQQDGRVGIQFVLRDAAVNPTVVWKSELKYALIGASADATAQALTGIPASATFPATFPAANVSLTDAGTYFASPDVEDALQEVGASLATLMADVATNTADIATNAGDIADLAGVGRTTETVKGNADDIANIAGVGRTTETVKANADMLAIMRTGFINVLDYGADPTGVADSSTAINNAIIASQDPDPYMAKVVVIPAGLYLINSSVNIPHGTEDNRVTIMGYGATLKAGTVGMDMIKVIAGDPATYLNLGETKIYGLRLEGDSKANRGIMIGRDGGMTNIYGCDGIWKSKLEDVDIRGCEDTCIEIADSRMWEFVSCSLISTSTGGNCIYLNETNDKFTGDLWFTNCQMQVKEDDVTAICVKAISTAVAGTSSIGGVHFSHCVFYRQAVYVEATNADAYFSDFFFDNCANDGWRTDLVNLASYYAYSFKAFTQDAGSVISMNDCWTNASGFGLYFYKCKGCHVQGGKVSSIYYQAILLADCNESTVENVKLFDVNTSNNGGGAMGLGNAGNRNKIIGCNIYNTSGHSTVIILINASQVKPIVTHNTTDGGTCVTNNVAGSEGVNFIVAGNL